MRSLTIKELADRLSVHHQTIRNHIRAGHLKARKMGQVWRIFRPDLVDYLGSEERADSLLKVNSDGKETSVHEVLHGRLVEGPGRPES
ncbi:helix-turn-helix domain-containing protein [Patescibacteria group bacterium]|nr:helix-turn-helix domain-containing protein [Patescibacteria group bacterium]